MVEITIIEQRSTKGNHPEKAVITAALTGGTTRDECESVPYTPAEIAEDARAVREAGASIVHVHARTPEGRETFETKVFQEIYDEIRDRTDILVNFSTGAKDEPVEFRTDYLEVVQPEMAGVNMGSMNYAEHSGEEFIVDHVFERPFENIETFLKTMQETGITPELECFETGHIGNTRPLLEQDILEHPLHISLVMGILGTIPASIENLAHLVRQIPDDATWQVVGFEEEQWPLVAGALSMGGNVRVGLEDNYCLPDGTITDNRGVVEKAAEMARNVGREPTTPDEARNIMAED